jgi:TrmH family RNA methyltransferase
MTRARLQEIAGLARPRERARRGQFLVEGVRSVEAAVHAGAPLVEVLAADGAADDPRVAALLTAAVDAGVPVHLVGARALERVSDAQTAQGVVAVARSGVADLDARPDALAGATTVVVLDGVQDPGNVGTVVRTAAWFGAAAVVAGPGTADFEGPKAVRSAMGGLWDVRLARTVALGRALDALRAAGLALYGADLAGTPAAGWHPGGPAALVLGSEAHGLSAAARARLDGTVRIEAPSPAGAPVGAPRGVESLNVAVAAGILLHRWLEGGDRG